jgi:hypothetical protein
MVVAVLALFVALGGSSYAAMRIQIGSAQIIDNSVQSRDIRNNDVRSVDIRDGSLHANDFAPGLLPSAYSTFKDSVTLRTGANQLVTVAQLNVPAGKYAIFAKLFMGPPFSGLNEAVRCELIAGVDFDRTQVNHDAEIAFAALSLEVVHEFPTAGSVSLNCGQLFTPGATSLGFVKITAVGVASLTNTPSP